jgi:general L-amino acid transport system permease protein
MMTAMEVVEFKPKPSRPAPRLTTGALGWLHTHLFYSWWSTAGTLVAGYFAGSFLVYLYGWGIADAVWQAGSRRECLDASPHGACWAGIGVWFESFLYGRYPVPERWRINLTFTILVLWLIPLWWPRVRARSVIAITAVSIFPFLAGYLLAGGERGWLMQFMMPLGIVVFIVNCLHVAMCLLAGRSLASWFYGVTGLDRKSERAHWFAVAGVCALLAVIAAGLLSNWSLPGIRTNLWGGLFVTFLIAGVGIVVSLPGGILLALIRRSRMPFMRACVIGYIEIVRSVPLVTVLFFAVTMTPLFLPPDMALNKLVLVLTAVSLFSTAYMAEVVRGGLQAVPLGQFEAAQSIGLGYWHMMRLIVLPQALRHMIPNIASQYIGLLKDTTVVSIVGLYDFLLMLRVPGQNSVWIGLYIEPFIFGGAVYFLLCYSISRYSRALERRGSGVSRSGLKPR